MTKYEESLEKQNEELRERLEAALEKLDQLEPNKHNYEILKEAVMVYLNGYGECSSYARGIICEAFGEQRSAALKDVEWEIELRKRGDWCPPECRGES